MISILFTKLVSKTRWVVERTFGRINRWFGSKRLITKDELVYMPSIL
ncbi:MAG: hypothetical protein ACMUEL_07225 [Flavobacteriales bacterium Tduv]